MPPEGYAPQLPAHALPLPSHIIQEDLKCDTSSTYSLRFDDRDGLGRMHSDSGHSNLTLVADPSPSHKSGQDQGKVIADSDVVQLDGQEKRKNEKSKPKSKSKSKPVESHGQATRTDDKTKTKPHNGTGTRSDGEDHNNKVGIESPTSTTRPTKPSSRPTKPSSRPSKPSSSSPNPKDPPPHSQSASSDHRINATDTPIPILTGLLRRASSLFTNSDKTLVSLRLATTPNEEQKIAESPSGEVPIWTLEKHQPQPPIRHTIPGGVAGSNTTGSTGLTTSTARPRRQADVKCNFWTFLGPCFDSRNDDWLIE